MTVAALAPDGTMTVQKLGASGRFRLAVKARGTTIQLIRATGAYFGPVVLRAKGGRAYLALGGKTVNLGRVVLRDGYAVPHREVPLGFLDRTRVARASAKGKPLGAGKLGLVRSRATRRLGVRSLGADGPQGAGADTDSDGIPNSADADDNGNLVLDNVDSTTQAGDAGLFSTLFLPLDRTINAASAPLTKAQIDAVLSGESMFNMIFFFDAGQFRGRTITGAHVDCFALRYCRRGSGTAILGGLSESSPDLPRGAPWVDYDPDGSGYPNLENITSHDGHDAWAAGIQPRVGTADIHPGDTYNVVFEAGGEPIMLPTVLSPYFVTTPAISSYTSGGLTGQISYPVSPGAAGTSASNPIDLPTGSITLTFWRPQRVGIPGADSAPFMDLGHLHYGVLPNVEGATEEIGCKGFYSGYSPTLTDGPASGDGFADDFWPLVDTAGDAVPSIVRTQSFTLDVAGCLNDSGVDPSGETVQLNLTASSESRPGGADRASQTLVVRLPT